MKTRDGYDMYDMLSMTEKAIKKRAIDIAAYCSYQVYGVDRFKLWELLISLADIECIRDELEAMKTADDIINKNGGYDRDPLFVAKAIVLLCLDPNDKRCGIRYGADDEFISIDRLKDVVVNDKEIPDWVFDCHTIKGKQRGKTDLDMVIDEQEALNPKRKGFFDDCSWYYSYEADYHHGRIGEKVWDKFLKFAEGRPVK